VSLPNRSYKATNWMFAVAAASAASLRRPRRHLAWGPRLVGREAQSLFLFSSARFGFVLPNLRIWLRSARLRRTLAAPRDPARNARHRELHYADAVRPPNEVTAAHGTLERGEIRLIRFGIDRDRGTSRDATPPTPPGIRVRTTAVRSQISGFLIHHAGWEGGQHGWANLIPSIFASG
jgi:hypothetical protein